MHKALFKLLGGTPPEAGRGEQGLCEGPANLFRGIVAVGGWLWLTNQRLAFRPHKVNVRAEVKSWPLGSIQGAMPVSTFLIIPNGLKVDLTDGTSLQFVVYERKLWAQEIEKALRSNRA